MGIGACPEMAGEGQTHCPSGADAIGGEIGAVRSGGNLVREGAEAAGSNATKSLLETLSSGAGKVKRLALGHTKFVKGKNGLEDVWLNRFAKKIGAKTYLDFTINPDDLHGSLRKMIDEHVAGGGEIHFNLRGVKNPQAVARGERVVGYTDWELHHICQSARLIAATVFHGGSNPC
jgi:hypothetical protein